MALVAAPTLAAILPALLTEAVITALACVVMLVALVVVLKGNRQL
jgi:hypothetical protein